MLRSIDDIQAGNYRDNIPPNITLEELFLYQDPWSNHNRAFVTVHTQDQYGQGYTGSRWIDRSVLREYEYKVSQESIYPNIVQVRIINWIFDPDKKPLKLIPS